MKYIFNPQPKPEPKPKKAKKPLKRTPIKRTKKVTGEWAMMLAIWAVRPHFCEVYKTYLGDDPKPIFFAHILRKSVYPELRLYDKNIAIMSPKAHNKYDNGDSEAYEFAEINQRKEILKQEYLKLKKGS